MATAVCHLRCFYPYNEDMSDCMNENDCCLFDDKKMSKDLKSEYSENEDKCIKKVESDLPEIIKSKLQSIHVSCFSEAILPTNVGKFRIRVYTSLECRDFSFQPVALISGKIENSSSVAVRVHDQCFTSEVFGSKKCDCKEQLEHAKSYIKENSGMVIYLQQEGRGIGLANKIAAYHLQDDGKDTVEANRCLGLEDDYRTYECVKQILEDLHISSIRLMTNNPYKKMCLEQLGIKIDSLIPVIIKPNEYDIGYLHCKAERMGHFLPLYKLSNTDNKTEKDNVENEIIM